MLRRLKLDCLAGKRCSGCFACWALGVKTEQQFLGCAWDCDTAFAYITIG